MRFKSKLMISLMFLFCSQAFAEAPMCINGDNSENDKLIKNYESSRDPLRMAFLSSKKNPNLSPEHCLPADTNKKNLRQIANLNSQIKSTGPKAPKIKRECIKASMTRSPGNDGYTCSQGTAKTYGTAGGRTLQCVNDSMVDYVTFSVNSAIQCMTPDKLIDSRVIYKKLNNETGFNSSLAARGGVGIGQLTTPAIKEIADPTLGKGRYLLEDIKNSTRPECQPFKHIATKDLEDRPRVQNTCDWVSPGDGLARNLIYSIGYYLVMRDHYVIPEIEKRSPNLAKNKSLVSDLTAVAYGAEGLDHVKWLLRRNRVNAKTKLDTFQKKVRKDSVYLTNIKSKMKEITCIRNGTDPVSKECKNQNISTPDLEADSCIIK